MVWVLSGGTWTATGRQGRRREKIREDLDTEGWVMSNWIRVIRAMSRSPVVVRSKA